MPNWCNNTLTLSGPKDKVKAIFDKAKESNELLQQLHPMPKELEGTTSPSDGDNWYDWRINNWQTKWDVDVDNLEFREDGDTGIIEGWFDSAWSPPIGAYEKFTDAMEGIDVEASYYECGMDYAGFWNAWDGDQCLENLREQYELPHHERGELYDLYMRLDDEWNLSANFEMWDDEEVES